MPSTGDSWREPHADPQGDPIDVEFTALSENPNGDSEDRPKIVGTWTIIREKIGGVFSRTTDVVLGKPASRGGKAGHPEKFTERAMTRRGALVAIGTAGVGTIAGATLLKVMGGSEESQEQASAQATPSSTPPTPAGNNAGSLNDPETGTQIWNTITGHTAREKWIRPATLHIMLRTVHGMCDTWREKQKKAGLNSSEKARKAALLDVLEVERADKSNVKSRRILAGSSVTPDQIAEFDRIMARITGLEAELHELEEKTKEQKPHTALQIESEAMPLTAGTTEVLVALWDLHDLLNGREFATIVSDVPYAIVRFIEHLFFYFNIAPRGKGTTPEQNIAMQRWTRRGAIAAILSGVGLLAYKGGWATLKKYFPSQNTPGNGAASQAQPTPTAPGQPSQTQSPATQGSAAPQKAEEPKLTEEEDPWGKVQLPKIQLKQEEQKERKQGTK